MPAFSIAYGNTKKHADALRAGLQKLPVGFIAQVCPICAGHGEYRQTYTAGCGGGYHHLMGGCDYCDGTGLLQGNKPAPSSVREQVLVAARK